MLHLPRSLGLALLAGLVPALAACNSSEPAATGPQGPAPTTATAPSQPSPLLCRLNKPDGGNCVTLQQLPMHPEQTAQGYATKLTWILTNECTYPMAVTWGWQEGVDAGQTVLRQGQATEVSCLWNIDGCSGNIDWVYRCSEVQ